jgi:polyhydroxybutyrate depolymerase
VGSTYDATGFKAACCSKVEAHRFRYSSPDETLGPGLATDGCRPLHRMRPARDAGQAAAPAPDLVAVSSSGSPGCGLNASQENVTGRISSGGIDRGFRLHVPASYHPGGPAPLVLNFHGLGSNATHQESYSGLIEESDEAGFILVTPEGSGTPQRWYFIDLPGAEVDDFAFVRALIGHLDQTFCIDQSRIYATGMSNGGFMSAALACEMSDVFAAVAPVAGVTYLPGCDGKPPVPIVVFHGTNDTVVPFGGGNIGPIPATLPGVRQTVSRWAQHNGCSAAPETQQVSSDVALETYGACTDAADVQLYVYRRRRSHLAWRAAAAVPGQDHPVHQGRWADLALLRRPPQIAASCELRALSFELVALHRPARTSSAFCRTPSFV